MNHGETRKERCVNVGIVHVITALALAVAPLAAFPASRYWITVNGSADGVWSDTNHWKDGNKPVAGDNVIFSTTYMKSGKIELDGSYSLNYIKVASADISVTIGGTGTITETTSTQQHIDTATSVLVIDDDAYYNASKPTYFISLGTLRMAGGCMSTARYTAGPLTDICGGSLTNTYSVFGSGCACTVSAGELRSTHTITFSSGSSLTATGGRISAASGITFESGSTFTLEGCQFDMGKVTFNSGSRIVLGPNATLRMPRTSFVGTTNIVADVTAKIVFYAPDGATADRTTPISLPAETIDVDDLGVNIELDAPEGWSGKSIGPCYFITGGVTTTPANTYEWTGAEDGYWSNSNNWHGGVAPTNANVWVYISGERNTVMTNDLTNAKFNSLHVLANTAPVIIRGNPVKLTTSTVGWNGNVALKSASSNPVILENEVVFDTVRGYTDSHGGSYLSLRGGLSQTSTSGSRFVYYNGTVYYGGTTSIRTVSINGAASASITCIEDADYTLTGQAVALTQAGPLNIRPGASLTVKGTCQVNNSSSKIDGTLNLDGTLTGSQSMGGRGVVKTSGTFSTTVGTNTVSLAGSLTLLPSSWNTQPEASTIFRINASSGTPRLAASSDWTYGPASGEPDATRALAIASGATLTIDTQDPSTGDGHTITLADPLDASGSLVKAGAGALVLPDGDVSVGGSLSLDGGALRVRGRIDVAGEFSAAEGTAMEFGEGVTVGKTFVTILEAASITGVPSFGEDYSVRVETDSETGRQRLRVHERTGVLLIFR